MKILKMQPAKMKTGIARTVADVVDFRVYAEAKKAELLAAQAAYVAQCAYRARLETFLKNLLAELEAA